MTVIVTSSLLAPWNFGSPPSIFTQSFGNFVQIIGNSFSQAGWVNTQASGSITDPYTLPTYLLGNAGTNVRSLGYQVFRMDDELHSQGYPVYIRMDYGNSANAFGMYNIAVTVGFTHDGSGSVGGYTMPYLGSRTSIVNAGFNNTANSEMYIAYGGRSPSGSLWDHRTCIISGGDMAFILANNAAGFTLGGSGFGFVERTKDVNGTSTNEGVFVGTYNGNDGIFRQSYLEYNKQNAGQAPIPETFVNYVHSNNAQSRNANFVTFGPVIPMISYGPHNPLRMAGFVKTSDFIGDGTYNLNVYNTSSVYFVSAAPAFNAWQLVNNQAITVNNRLAIRSE